MRDHARHGDTETECRVVHGLRDTGSEHLLPFGGADAFLRNGAEESLFLRLRGYAMPD